MFNIDKTLKNIMGNKNNKQFNSFKPIELNITNKMLNNVNIKPASTKMQNQWKGFSNYTKNLMRQKYPDTDGDRIPDRWDCSPNNTFRQDWKHTYSFSGTDKNIRTVNLPPETFLKNTMEEVNIRALKQKDKKFKNQKEYEDFVLRNESINWHKQQLKENKDVNIPFLTFDKQGNPIGHEGRHTAKAAQLLGYKTIPVTIEQSKQTINPHTYFDLEEYKDQPWEGEEREKFVFQRGKINKWDRFIVNPDTGEWVRNSNYGGYVHESRLQEKKVLNKFMDDNDNDGVINALDCCPNDSTKQGPGDNTEMFLPDGSLNPNNPRVQWGAASKVKGKYVRFPIIQQEINPITKDIEKQVVGFGKRYINYEEQNLPNIKDVQKINKQMAQFQSKKLGEQYRDEYLRKEKERENINREKYEKQMLNKFMDDNDNDGVINALDCAPNDPNKQDIRWGRRPKHMTPEEYLKYQNQINILTYNKPSQIQLENPKTQLNQITKINTILTHDKEIKKLNQTIPFYRDENWQLKYNEQVRNALKQQGYSEDTANDYLEHKSKVSQDFGNFFIKELKREGTYDKIFGNNKKEQWNDKPKSEQITERITQPDSDGDGVPDRDDCDPNDPNRQDTYNDVDMSDMQYLLDNGQITNQQFDYVLRQRIKQKQEQKNNINNIPYLNLSKKQAQMDSRYIGDIGLGY
jgi:hypothetical protein